mmetsp:Transcript_7681/g.22560  ORF Transcript_7681/g.22560 Transcript_7681/m.22560 type:complete len:210 (-) Transcript_7681:381-1010(-)
MTEGQMTQIQQVLPQQLRAVRKIPLKSDLRECRDVHHPLDQRRYREGRRFGEGERGGGRVGPHPHHTSRLTHGVRGDVARSLGDAGSGLGDPAARSRVVEFPSVIRALQSSLGRRRGHLRAVAVVVAAAAFGGFGGFEHPPLAERGEAVSASVVEARPSPALVVVVVRLRLPQHELSPEQFDPVGTIRFQRRDERYRPPVVLQRPYRRR